MREGKNNLTIIGTLKSKEVKYGSHNGANTISVDLVVESNFDNKIHENRIRLWAKETSKLFKSYVTVANEYKTSELNGELADRVKIDGSLDMNEYVNNDGDLKTFNNLRGTFVNRLVNKPEVKDEVGAVVECVVLGFTDEMSKEGTMTGRKKVNLLTVGYNNSISELQNVVVEEDLAQQFARLYQPNSTGELYIKVNNYVEVEEVQENKTPAANIGFGASLDNMPDSVIKKYVNNLQIIGGGMPKVTGQYTIQEIQEMKQLREMAKQEKLTATPKSPAQQSGFGSGFGTPNINPDTAFDGFEDPFK